MKKTIICVIGIAILLTATYFILRKSVIDTDIVVSQKQADVEANLQRRSENISNLVATVKGYTKHEEKVYSELAEARAKLNSSVESKDVDEMQKADSQATDAVRNFLAVAEAYPDLKASEQFIRLQDEIAGTENRLLRARQEYNKVVAEYNSKVRNFPTSIIAENLGLTIKPMFEAEESKKENPVVDFNK